MHGDDAVEWFRIERISKWRAAKADDTEHRTPALSAADRDARHRADHVLKARDIGLRPIGLVRKCCAIGRAIEHIEGLRGIEAEIFRGAFMGDVTPRLEK